MINSSTKAPNDAKPVLSPVFLHQKIERLIPFISEEFITYPLWEEGKYIPFVNFWQKTDLPKKTNNQFYELEQKLNSVFKKTGYVLEYVDNNTTDTIHYFQVYPEFKELKNGSYQFIKKDWSIEEMLDLLGSVLK